MIDRLSRIIAKFALNSISTEMEHRINRIKVVLAELKKSNKWLAEQIGKDTSTVSKWCTNSAQPRFDTLKRIADILDVDIRTLLNPTKQDTDYVAYMKVTITPKIIKQEKND